MTTKPKVTPKAKPTPASSKKPAGEKARAQKTVKVQEAEVRITAKQQRFVDEYLVDQNGTQAAIRAGYSAKTAQQMATENLLKPVVRAAIEAGLAKQQERTGITADRVLQEVARIGLFDPRKLFRDDGEPKDIHELDDDTAAAISGVKISTRKDEDGKGETTVTEYKVSDKNTALEKLFKHLGLYELDNQQRVDPLVAVLERINAAGNVGFMPVAHDPEHDEG
ncbi:Terminase small subunit [Pseudomonas guineae]|uniref:Terminase small subunit n=1 Tax=Pseudomonas guineae TaxID=425504 RepID=A0A1I3KBP5_9PSED|nr:terminase small subunit [Pseudomonas guineae]SFI69770.1 Terminase small subunit [Pseudomonas guineae]